MKWRYISGLKTSKDFKKQVEGSGPDVTVLDGFCLDYTYLRCLSRFSEEFVALHGAH